MKTKNLQVKIDLMIKKLILWAIPKSLKPNYFTWARIASVPFLAYFLLNHNYRIAFFLFLFSAATDFIDGALARTRDQETELGKIIDPIADKLLVGTALGILGFQYLIVKIFLVSIGLEILAILTSSVLAYQLGRPPGANVFGKVKMILQSFSIALLIPGILFENLFLVQAATLLLMLALFFAVVSDVMQLQTKINNIFKFLHLEKSVQTLKDLLRKI